jgi:M6 family metalloprotease-like protein
VLHWFPAAFYGLFTRMRGEEEMPVPFAGKEFTFHNPDGSEIRVRGWGNQFAAVFETLDGYTVVKDPDSGFYHYAEQSRDGEGLAASRALVGEVEPATLGIPPHLRPTHEHTRATALAAREVSGQRRRWEVRREQRRARQRAAGEDEERAGVLKEPQAAPKTGVRVGLCLLLQFPDVLGTITKAQVTDFCNKPGYTGFGNEGSVYDYFLSVSAGRLRYTNQVTAYYTAKHPFAYYTNPAIGFGVRAQELIVEALNALKAQHFDFSGLSSDGSGFVYALNAFYAGFCPNNWSEGLWPHSSGLDSAFVASATKTFSDYQISDMGSDLTLGTFCHENGHMVCDFPDLYDYGSESSGVGEYSLMCAFGPPTNPTQVDAYLKDVAGWTTKLTTLTPGMTAAVAAGTNEFLIHRKNATEYFIMENRARSVRDAALPDAGLAIWHVDQLGSNNDEEMTPAQHYECSLEQADHRFDLEHGANLGDTGDLFGGPGARSFGSATTPDSRWWDGSLSGLDLAQISAPGPTITVKTALTPPVVTAPVVPPIVSLLA